MSFKKATRTSFKVVGGLLGISGAGKTLSALLIARGLVGPEGKIAVVSAGEHKAPAAYANDVDFDMMELSPPYDLKALVTSARQAKDLGYDILIVDSLSAFWDGTGGLVDLAEETKIREGKNDWNVWACISPKINKMWEVLRGIGIHIILTVREKTVYVQEKNDKGRLQPKKAGTSPIWKPDPGIEYELDFVLKINSLHRAMFSSKRLKDLNDRIIEKPGVEFGKLIKDYLDGTPLTDAPGALVPKVPPPPPELPDDPEEVATETDARTKLMGEIEDLAEATGRSMADWLPKIATKYGKESIDKVPQTKLKEFIKEVKAKLASQGGAGE